MLSVVKENLVWLQDVFTTLINKTDPYHQKLAFFKANYFIHGKENGFRFEKQKRVWLTLVHFVIILSDGCCQMTVANWQRFHQNFFDVRPKTYSHCKS